MQGSWILIRLTYQQQLYWICRVCQVVCAVFLSIFFKNKSTPLLSFDFHFWLFVTQTLCLKKPWPALSLCRFKRERQSSEHGWDDQRAYICGRHEELYDVRSAQRWWRRRLQTALQCMHTCLPPVGLLRDISHGFLLDQVTSELHKRTFINRILFLSLIHIWRCRRIERCRSRWSPYH